MRHLKNLLLTAFLLLFSLLAGYGQELKFGARATLGTGTINSKALQSYFNAENAKDADIKSTT